MMVSDMFRLVYVSHRSLTCDEAEVEQILDVSRSRNNDDHIVGALMVSEKRFAQVLEGPHDQVQDTFERIGMDERHVEPLVLTFERIDQPCFPGWSMAHVTVADDAIAIDALLRSAGSTESARLIALARDLALTNDISHAT